MIESAMRKCHVNVTSARAAKTQALDAIPQLQQVMPIERAPMRVRVTCGPVGAGERCQ